ncbi:MAG: hypothetical protein EOP38_09020 [Rubrivivax sp.]|nr:MAG: hypothetical protein EOP38_09020 [Rubrivivax sp.]
MVLLLASTRVTPEAALERAKIGITLAAVPRSAKTATAVLAAVVFRRVPTLASAASEAGAESAMGRPRSPEITARPLEIAKPAFVVVLAGRAPIAFLPTLLRTETLLPKRRLIMAGRVGIAVRAATALWRPSVLGPAILRATARAELAVLILATAELATLLTALLPTLLAATRLIARTEMATKLLTAFRRIVASLSHGFVLSSSAELAKTGAPKALGRLRKNGQSLYLKVGDQRASARLCRATFSTGQQGVFSCGFWVFVSVGCRLLIGLIGRLLCRIDPCEVRILQRRATVKGSALIGRRARTMPNAHGAPIRQADGPTDQDILRPVVRAMNGQAAHGRARQWYLELGWQGRKNGSAWNE